MVLTKSTVPTKSTQLLLSGIVVAAVACGGGGASKPKNESDGLPQQTGQAFSRADAVTLAAGEITAVAQFGGAVSGDVTSPEGVIDAFNTATLAEVGSLAITTTTFFCNSADPQNIDTGNGSVTITTDDQDPAGRSTGDSVTTTFNQCNQFGGIANGTTSNKINALTGDPFVTAPWVVDTTHSTDLSRTSARGSSTTKSTASSKAESADGVVIVRTTAGEGSRTGTDGAGVATSSTSRFSSKSTTDLNLQTKTNEFDMNSTSGTSTRSAKTATPIAGPLNGAPTSGVIEIREADPAAGLNRIVRVTMQSDGTALVEVDADGDGVFEQTFTTPWFGGIGFGGGFGGAPGLGGGTGTGPGFGGGRFVPPVGGGSPVSPVPPAPAGGFGGGTFRPRV